MHAHYRATADGGELRLTGVNMAASRTFALTGTDRLFRIFATGALAQAATRRPRP